MNKAVQILLKNAIAHIRLKEFTQAKELLQKATVADPKEADPLRLMAVIAAMEFQFQDALTHITHALALDPKNGLAYSNKGNILKELGRYEEALVVLDMAIQLLPSYAEAYSNKGNVLQELYRYEESVGCYDKAIALNPQYAEAYSNKGNALVLLGRPQEAMQCFDQATAINPDYVDAYWHKGLLQLNHGDYQNGWQNYEARWFKSNPLQFQFSEIPRLESLENISGKRVLIWGEQGLGDTLQFCRYIKPLFQQGAIITFKVQAPLIKILGSLSSNCKLVSNILDEEIQQFDFQSPLLSLPLLFNTEINSVPAEIPYLTIGPLEQEVCPIELKDSERLKVGLIWNGGFRAEHPELWTVNKRRNIELDQIAALRDIQGVDFYSLQKGDPAESELTARKELVWPELINCIELLNDFSDTAAVMESLDLIISVDTSSAHLAGALGKPVWILNRYDSCWRWLKGREDSPWYPTAKIYQQKHPGNWDEVIVRVKADLNDLAQKKRAAI